MHPRVAELVATFDLVPHPEGGYFREIHRSVHRVLPDDGRPSRAALTVIYFLLAAGQQSAWHRVRSDETWHFHEGDPLELSVAPADSASAVVYRLGPAGAGGHPVRVVPAGYWQAARPTGSYAFVSCSVGPGFEFEDFEMRHPTDAGGRVPGA
jgi:predicted cupin superfamily sugar epimerase